MEFLISIVFILCIAFGIFSVAKPSPEPPQIIQSKPNSLRKRKIQPNKKKENKEKKQVDPNINEAKQTLVAFGYTVTEAKALLKGIKASSVEEYVSQAMKKVKI